MSFACFRIYTISCEFVKLAKTVKELAESWPKAGRKLIVLKFETIVLKFETEGIWNQNLTRMDTRLRAC